MLNFKCSNCDTEFTINSKVETRTYISCPICTILVKDEFDYENEKEQDEW